MVGIMDARWIVRVRVLCTVPCEQVAEQTDRGTCYISSWRAVASNKQAWIRVGGSELEERMKGEGTAQQRLSRQHVTALVHITSTVPYSTSSRVDGFGCKSVNKRNETTGPRCGKEGAPGWLGWSGPALDWSESYLPALTGVLPANGCEWLRMAAAGAAPAPASPACSCLDAQAGDLGELNWPALVRVQKGYCEYCAVL